MPEGHADYQLLFDASPRPMIVFDRETLAILAANEAASTDFGWTHDELLAMTGYDLWPPRDAGELEQIVDEAAKWQDPNLERAGRLRTKDGRSLEVDLAIRRLEFRGRPASLVIYT